MSLSENNILKNLTNQYKSKFKIHKLDYFYQLYNHKLFSSTKKLFLQNKSVVYCIIIILKYLNNKYIFYYFKIHYYFLLFKNKLKKTIFSNTVVGIKRFNLKQSDNTF